MIDRLSPPDRAKLMSAYHAMQFVEDEMRLGLGTGSTAAWLVKLLGAEKHVFGLEIQCVATSTQTQELAERVGLRMISLDQAGWLDLVIDGTDEFDPLLSLIKGGGGALLQEKIVATASDRMVVIADPSKEVDRLGAFPLPVEIVRFGSEVTKGLIEDKLAGFDVATRRTHWREKAGKRLITDEGHYILDLNLGEIRDVDTIASGLLEIPGVVETGLFLDIADTVVMGVASGEARLIFSDDPEMLVDISDTDHFDALMAHLAETGELQ
ncbi:ribose-5-phosphate isomerase RpiA [Algicella marina]|uniref:Ribose-5-phosphate isomerase A n=1 Tax=Algicella marina TaxID=2683284 RepID=A0A6P1T3B3_9RHOB|nr:ribose-5-phosphate isomerase RpiA [Algicella marina]QHQ35002.1 ribose-5-phosphate isomerase RpiA [Algicella marina]